MARGKFCGPGDSLWLCLFGVLPGILTTRLHLSCHLRKCLLPAEVQGFGPLGVRSVLGFEDCAALQVCWESMPPRSRPRGSPAGRRHRPILIGARPLPFVHSGSAAFASNNLSTGPRGWIGTHRPPSGRRRGWSRTITLWPASLELCEQHVLAPEAFQTQQDETRIRQSSQISLSLSLLLIFCVVLGKLGFRASVNRPVGPGINCSGDLRAGPQADDCRSVPDLLLGPTLDGMPTGVLTRTPPPL